MPQAWSGRRTSGLKSPALPKHPFLSGPEFCFPSKPRILFPPEREPALLSLSVRPLVQSRGRQIVGQSEDAVCSRQPSPVASGGASSEPSLRAGIHPTRALLSVVPEVWPATMSLFAVASFAYPDSNALILFPSNTSTLKRAHP